MLKAIKPYQGIKRGGTGKGKGGTFALKNFQLWDNLKLRRLRHI